MIVKIDFPPAKLFPNRSSGQHWASLRKIKDEYRDAAYYTAMQERAKSELTLEMVHECDTTPLSIVFVCPDARKRDLDNLLAASKHGIDGIAQALGIDDSKFRPITIDSEVGTKESACVLVGVGVSI